jgi:hypothetical protein
MGLFRVFLMVGIPLAIVSSLLILFGISQSHTPSTFLDFAYLGALLA